MVALQLVAVAGIWTVWMRPSLKYTETMYPEIRALVLLTQVADMVEVAAHTSLPATLVGGETTIVLIVVGAVTLSENAAEAGVPAPTTTVSRRPITTVARRRAVMTGPPLRSWWAARCSAGATRRGAPVRRRAERSTPRGSAGPRSGCRASGERRAPGRRCRPAMSPSTGRRRRSRRP